MRTTLAASAIALVLALNACGGSATDQRCATFKADGQQYAQNFSATSPTPLSAQEIATLARSAYQADAASHNISCP